MTYYPNVVIKIDRKYIEQDLKSVENTFKLLDENGNLDDVTFDSIAHELFVNIDQFIKKCYSKVERDTARFERNMGANDSNPHYKLYSKCGKGDFELDGVFTNLSDARDTINEDSEKLADNCEYMITEVKDGIEGTKNFYQPTLF